MSHSYGAVQFDSDDKVMFYEYDGTSDVTISHLYDTRKEMEDNWRKGEWLDCKCGRDEPVEIYSNYGGGFYWDGRACRHCLAITENLKPDWDDGSSSSDGTPDWVGEELE